ncbi:MAG: hypothetical protein WCC60_03320 [Ilumatobacteraceae bacterium]
MRTFHHVSILSVVSIVFATCSGCSGSDAHPGPTSNVDTDTAADTTGSTTSSPVTTDLPATLIAWQVMPYGTRSEWAGLRGYETAITPGAAPPAGAPALVYDLEIGFPPDGRSFGIEASSATDDGQLAIEVACATDDCSSLPSVNDRVQTTLHLTVRRTPAELTAGEHPAQFRLHFDDGTVEEFQVVLFAEPAPSAAAAVAVTAGSGTPARVQTVFGVGRFLYHSIAAFGSLWVLGKVSGTVTRIDAVTGAVVASVRIGEPGSGAHSRLAADDSAVYVGGTPLLRINPATNEVSTIADSVADGAGAIAIVAGGTAVWTAGHEGPIQRIDTDGTVTDLGLPTARWIDLALSGGLVWAASQEPGGGRLIAFDGTTGAIVHDVPVATDVDGFVVRLVADERNVVVGLDTSGGGGRTGEVVIVDPTTGMITDTVQLGSRPEGIALTDGHIWTSGAVIDRDGLRVTEVDLGFTVALGPDGSIWATRAVPGSDSSIVTRTTPGGFAG